jgi:uncharacterized Zn finger protein
MEERIPKIIIDLDLIESEVPSPIWEKGREYFESGRVGVVSLRGEGEFRARVDGTSKTSYSVSATIENGRLSSHQCECEAHRRFPGPCKHVIALLLKADSLFGRHSEFDGDYPFDSF